MRRLVEAFGDGLPARVGQATRTQSSIAKIGWFLQHDVNVTRWLGAAELGLWTLTGEEATEPSLACRTGAFDIRRSCFIEDVVTAVGAPPRVFPLVQRAGDSHGLVSSEGAAWLGLPAGIPVTVAGHDHMVGAVGVGIDRSDLLDSIGTLLPRGISQHTAWCVAGLSVQFLARTRVAFGATSARPAGMSRMISKTPLIRVRVGQFHDCLLAVRNQVRLANSPARPSS